MFCNYYSIKAGGVTKLSVILNVSRITHKRINRRRGQGVTLSSSSSFLACNSKIA